MGLLVHMQSTHKIDTRLVAPRERYLKLSLSATIHDVDMYVTVCLPDHVKQDSGNKHAWIPADVVEPLQTEIQPAVPQLF